MASLSPQQVSALFEFSGSSDAEQAIQGLRQHQGSEVQGEAPAERPTGA